MAVAVTVAAAAEMVRPGELDLSFNPGTGADGPVHTVAVQSDGRIVIGGAFDSFDGVPRNGLARLEANGRLDLSFDPQPGPIPQRPEFRIAIDTLAIQTDGKILAGGAFTQFDGSPANRMVRLNPDGTRDFGFNTPSEIRAVHAFALDSQERLLTAVLFPIDNRYWSPLVRLHTNGQLDLSFKPPQFGFPYSRTILTHPLEEQVLLGGSFPEAPDGQRLVQLAPDGSSIWSATREAIEGSPVSLTWQGTRGILVGFGGEISSGGSIVRLTLNGQRDTSFRTWATGSINALVTDSTDRVLVATGAGMAGDQKRNGIVRLLPDGALDTRFHPGLGVDTGIVNGMVVQQDEKLLLVGEFKSYDGHPRSGVARIHLGDLEDPVPQIFQQPQGAHPDVGSDLLLYVAATGHPPLRFQWRHAGQNIPGATNDTLNLTRLTAPDAGDYSVLVSNPFGLAISANATISIPSQPIWPGAIDYSFKGPEFPYGAALFPSLPGDGKFYIAGHFATLPRTNLARFNFDGSLDESFASPFTGFYLPQRLIVQPDGRIIVAGFRMNGDFGPDVVRLNPNGSLDSSFNATISLPYNNAVALKDDGKFLIVRVTTDREEELVRLNRDGSLDEDFAARDPRLGAARFYNFRAVVQLDDGRIALSATHFNPSAGDQSRILILERDGTRIVDEGFHFSSEVLGGYATPTALVKQSDGRLLIGGSFTSVDGAEAWRIVRMNTDGTLDPTFPLNPEPNVSAGQILVQPNGKLIVVGAAIVRLNSDGSIDPGFHVPIKYIQSVINAPEGKLIATHGYALVRLHGGEPPPGTPIVTTQPIAQSVRLGGHTSFSVHVVSATAFSAQWELDREPIPGATNLVLQLEDVKLQQGGHYRVVLQNSEGTTSSDEVELKFVELGNRRITVDPEFSPGAGPDGPIQAIAIQADGRIILGGYFRSYQNIPCRHMARIYRDGALDESFDAGMTFTNPVRFVSILADGRIAAAELLKDVYGDATRVRVSRLSISGTIEHGVTFDLQWRRALGLDRDGALFATEGSELLKFGSPVALDPSGEILIAPYNLDYQGVAVDAMGRIFITGDFQSIGGEIRNRLARLNVSGTLDRSFIPTGPRRLSSSMVSGLDGDIWAASSSEVSRTNCDGHLEFYQDFWLEPSPGSIIGGISALAAAPGGDLIIGGSFGAVDQIRRANIARLRVARLEGQAPAIRTHPADQFLVEGHTATFSVITESQDCVTHQWFHDGLPLAREISRVLTIRNLRKEHQGLYLVKVRNSRGEVVSRAARLVISSADTSAGSVDLDYPSVQPDAPVTVLVAQSDGSVIVGGAFRTIQGEPRAGLARLDSKGFLDPAFLPPDIVRTRGVSPVSSVVPLSDGRLMVAGPFNIRTNSQRAGVMRLLSTGALDETFASGSGPVSRDPGWIHTIVEDGEGGFLVGGSFESFSGGPATGLIRLRENGDLEPGFSLVLAHWYSDGSKATATVASIVRQGVNAFIVGGYFTHANGMARPGLLRIENGRLDPRFVPGFSMGSVNKVALEPDGAILVQGYFTLPGWGPRYAIVRLRANGAIESVIGPDAPTFNLLGIQPDGMILGADKSSVIRYTSDGIVDDTFEAQVASAWVSVQTVLPVSGRLLVGGGFDFINGTPRANLAWLAADSPRILRLFSSRLDERGFTTSIQSDSGGTYVLEFKASLTESAWTPVASTAGDGGVKKLNDPLAAARNGFYRVRVDE